MLVSNIGQDYKLSSRIDPGELMPQVALQPDGTTDWTLCSGGPQTMLQDWIRPQAVLYDQERMQTVARSWKRLQSGLHGQADLSGCVSLLSKIVGWAFWLGDTSGCILHLGGARD